MSMQSNVPIGATVRSGGDIRRLPVYLLLDTSWSMKGAPIEAVRRGLEQFQREVADDQFACEVVTVGVITFSSTAQLVTNGLVPISVFQPPLLEAQGVTRLDLALQMLLDSMESHLVKPVKSDSNGQGGRRGDYKPAVFILTDGQPTDAGGNVTDSLWQPARDALVSRLKGQIKPSDIVVVGCGPHVQPTTLKAISTGTAFLMRDDQAAFVALFQYLTQSISSSVQPGGNPNQPFAGTQPSDDLVRIA